MERSLLASAALVASCTCGEAEVAPSLPPVDPGPALAPWSGPANVDGPGHLEEGAAKFTARLSAIPTDLRPDVLGSIDPEQPLTATLGRGTHHRVAWTQRRGTSWRDVFPEGTACEVFDDADCLRTSDAIVGVMQQADHVRADVVSPESADQAQSFFEAPVGRGPSLSGDVVAEWNAVHDLLGPPSPAAISHGDAAFTTGETDRLRVRWALNDAPEPEQSQAAAPSWSALCDGARACFRTGPWPDIGAWIVRHPPVPLRASDTVSALTAVATLWPHHLASLIEQSRSRLPPPAQGFFDQTLSGLGDVAFSGGRLDDDGTGIAFVRVPTVWVNFTSSALAYAGFPSPPHRLEDGTEVSWAPMPGGGVIMALDDGVDPAMGWIAFATSPQKFAWLQRLPKTQAGTSSVFVRITRLADVLAFAPPILRRALAEHEQAALIVHLARDQGFLVATAELRPKVR